MRRWLVLLGGLLAMAGLQACPLAEDLVRRYGISATGFEREIPAEAANFGGGDERVVQVPLNGRGAILDGYSHLAFVHTLSKQAWILRSGGYAGVREWYGPVTVDLALLGGCAGAEPPVAGEVLAPVRCASVGPDVPQRDMKLAEILGETGERVHFYRGWDGCPERGAACRENSYLIPGDQAVVSQSKGEWSCVWYQGRQRQFIEWVPTNKLKLLPAPPVPNPDDWLGLWVDEPQHIRITRDSGGQLQMDSELRWDGGLSMSGEPYSNYGGMTAPLRMAGATASAADDWCKVGMTLLGRILVVNDSGVCGGINVRHRGMYVRK